MNGSIAIGSRRTTPTLPFAAAVVSLDPGAPMKTPCCQAPDPVPSGTVVAARPPKKIAEIGTPFGSSNSGAMIGHCDIGVQYREFGCAAASFESGVQSCFFHEVRCAGGA